MQTAPEIADTSVFRMMQLMMAETHEQRGISVLSGPPGIGKTTAIDEFERRFDGQCLVVKALPSPRGIGASPVSLLQLLTAAFCDSRGLHHYSNQRTQIAYLTSNFRSLLHSCYFAEEMEHQLLTFVFDEAQYLSRAAIETLRFWNDADRTIMPFPIGLIFIGNNEFALAPGRDGESVLSEAVRDRLLHSEELAYANLSDDDIRKVAATRGVADRAAVGVIIEYFARMRRPRSLRQIGRIIANCNRLAQGAPVTAQLVNDVLNPR
ncbi:ATP-binding protein [Sphingopyxis sp. GW247-27LB]|uniref:ATP-binding protein n=1 Tax=Sphingopyxis sp. GW247-27LB TaxID=2012632 RepID=UPI000BA6680A|nr:ATP-binding protein [Sphingopyxis sp. GW247-27LB]PAL22659.1 hypothetical protein CD928_11400 [Sphingopyxis sp. GW247-27LB]